MSEKVRFLVFHFDPLEWNEDELREVTDSVGECLPEDVRALFISKELELLESGELLEVAETLQDVAETE